MPFGSSGEVVESLSDKVPQPVQESPSFSSDVDSLDTQGRPEPRLAAWGDFAKLSAPSGEQDDDDSSGLLETVRQALRANYVIFPLLGATCQASIVSRVFSRLMLAWTVALMTCLAMTLWLAELDMVPTAFLATAAAWLVLSIETMWQYARSSTPLSAPTGFDRDKLISIEACAWDEASEVSFDSQEPDLPTPASKPTAQPVTGSPRLAGISAGLSPCARVTDRTPSSSSARPGGHGLQDAKFHRSCSDGSDAVSTASSSIRFGPPSVASSSSLCASKRIDRGKSNKSMASIVSVGSDGPPQAKSKAVDAWTVSSCPELGSRRPEEKSQERSPMAIGAGDQRLDFEEIALTIAALDEDRGPALPCSAITWAASFVAAIASVALIFARSDQLWPELGDIFVISSFCWLLSVLCLDLLGTVSLAILATILARNRSRNLSRGRSSLNRFKQEGPVGGPPLQAVVPSSPVREATIQTLDV